MKNFLNSLFSLNGESPTYLPARIRLADGSTRSPVSVTSDELNQIGYTGPYDIPDYDPDTECLVWDKTSLSYEVRIKEVSDDLIREDFCTRTCLREQLSRCDVDSNEDLTYEYLAYVTQLKDNILTLLSSPNLLRHDCVPSFEPPQYKTISEVNQYLYDTYYSSARWKDIYQSFGIIYGIEPYLRKYFKPPVDWVYNPISNVQFMQYVNELTGLPTVSGIAPPVSGCFISNEGKLELLIATDYFFPYV